MSSDIRFKNDIEEIDSNYALNIINKIKTKAFNFIEPTKRKDSKTIGFIAQEVKEHLPSVINYQNSCIPDEKRKIKNIIWEEVLLDEDTKKYKIEIPDITFEKNNTGLCNFYVSNNGDKKEEIIDIKVENDKKSFLFNKKYDNVFLNGKEINDFHTIDENQIFALHHSAIQELSKQNDNINKTFNNLKGSNEDLKKTNNFLINKLSNLENELELIKNKLGI